MGRLLSMVERFATARKPVQFYSSSTMLHRAFEHMMLEDQLKCLKLLVAAWEIRSQREDLERVLHAKAFNALTAGRLLMFTLTEGNQFCGWYGPPISLKGVCHPADEPHLLFGVCGLWTIVAECKHALLGSAEPDTVIEGCEVWNAYYVG